MPRTRSGVPIHRNSRARSTFEDGWWRPIAAADGRLIQLAAERYDRQNKKPGARCGPIGHVGHEVLGLFMRLQQSTPAGRLDPSYVWIAKTLRRSIDAVWRALNRLKAVGILEAQPRVERDAATWQWHQASNAYRLLQPRWITKVLPIVAQPTPEPEDFGHAAEAATDARYQQERELPLDDYAKHTVEEPSLAAALARLGSVVGQHHDSAGRIESLPVLSLRDESGAGLSAGNMDRLGAPAAPNRLGGRVIAKPAPS